MTEQLDLGAPEQTAPGTNNWRPVLLHLNWEKATIKVGFRGENGEYKSVGWRDAEATTLLVALNKANLSVNSLHKRILQQTLDDGLLAGTISGAPD